MLCQVGKEVKCIAVYFSSVRELEDGVYYKDGEIVLSENGEKTVVVRTDEVNLVGLHNFENIAAAVAMTYYAGVPLDILREVTKKFVAVEHRIEFVEKINACG